MSGICTIMGVPFNNLSMTEAVGITLINLKERKKTVIYTPNPEMVMAAQKDREFMQVLNSADLLIPDGIGVVKASKFYHNPIKERVAGCDLIEEVFARVKTTVNTVYFLGGAEGVAEKAKQKMQRKYRGLTISGTHHGYFKDGSPEEKEVIDEINRLNPEILLVGLGFPRQEKWIAKHRDKLNSIIIMGVGGSFDVLSGNTKRAPEFYRNHGLEWFYRLITQPTRFKRMLVLPVFLVRAIGERFGAKIEFNGDKVSIKKANSKKRKRSSGSSKSTNNREINRERTPRRTKGSK
ncbi:MAG: WecB/TagA/CpsF family glycosyltransferase [Clostridiales bacterium]|nr:WecB/TagA/CpsF family glycosyltransferase [Clostridiales bacterium]